MIRVEVSLDMWAWIAGDNLGSTPFDHCNLKAFLICVAVQIEDLLQSCISDNISAKGNWEYLNYSELLNTNSLMVYNIVQFMNVCLFK